MKKLLKMVCLTVSIMISTIILIPGSTMAWDSDFDADIRPGQYENFPIPIDETNVDIKIESDIPVDVYVMTDVQYVQYESTRIASGYEESYPAVTSKSFDYDAHGTLIQWVVIVNDDPSLTANVTVEFVVGEELTGACCGTTEFVGMSILIGVVAILYVMKRR